MEDIVSPSPRRDRRIALLKPQDARDARAMHAIQLLSSMLWAFRGTTRAAWETASADEADVVVFHTDDDQNGRVASWQASGKLAVRIHTDPSSIPTSRHALIYPFRAAQALALLEQLDVELQAGAATLETTHDVIPKDERWAFAQTLATLRSQPAPQGWSVACSDSTPLIWIKAAGAGYFAQADTVQAIRRGTLRLERLHLETPLNPPANASLRPEPELSWFVAYHASPRLFEGLRGTTAYQLTRWPDFGAIRPPRPQLRAAAILAGEAVMAADVATRAQMSLEEASRTMNALAVHGLLRSTAAAATGPRAAAGSSLGALGSLLRKLRQHLGLGD